MISIDGKYFAVNNRNSLALRTRFPYPCSRGTDTPTGSAAASLSSSADKATHLQLKNKVLSVKGDDLVDLNDSSHLDNSFVLYKVCSIKDPKAEPVYMIITKRLASHKEIDDERKKILALYKERNQGVDLESIDYYQKGGGHLIFLGDHREIEVYGHSRTFGRADWKLVAQIVKSQFPDFKVFYPVEFEIQ